MGKFLETEKVNQTEFKKSSPYISDAARADGIYKGKPWPFCLPVEHAEENLFSPIRKAALEFFASKNIKWHDENSGKPSNHLCDSQVCCVNFLFPFSDRPDELAILLRRVFPGLKRMLPVEDGRYVTFEWIGQKNYLNEKVAGESDRSRGANCTSADAMVMFEREDGKKQTALIEWKYTESYPSTSKKIAESGTDRSEIYRPLFERDDCPLDKELLPSFDDLFYEPFYQLMRLQFLAHEMEVAREMEADVVSLLYIAPDSNVDFRKVTSPGLESLGDTPLSVWQRLVRQKDRFSAVSTERLFGGWSADELPGLGDWMDYIKARYTRMK